VRRGVSLLEVLVGMAILAVAGIAVIGALRQSAKEVDTTSDYTLALGLSQRLVEETLQSVLDNPHLESGSPYWGGARAQIKEGGHARFRAVEDTAPPYGRLEARTDLAVDPRDANLFRMYREFSLSLQTGDERVTELEGAPPHLLDVDITLDCPGVKDAQRTFMVPILLAKPQISPEHAPPVAQDLPGLDAAIRTAFFPASVATSLELAVSTAGADLSLVRDLGSIVVVLQTAAEDLAKLDRDIALRATATSALPPTPEKAVELMALGRLQEKRAALAWRSLLYCRAPAGRISSGFTRQQIGGAGGPSSLFISAVMRRAASLKSELELGCAAALSSYLGARRLTPAATMRPYRQLCLERKILELAKLRVLLADGRGIEFVASWVGYLERVYRGRNSSVEDFLALESAHARTVDALRQLHPVVATRIEACVAATDHLRRLRDRLP
jgi:prepilin-type N-terminal cleavage/methylation domain-containing protein